MSWFSRAEDRERRRDDISPGEVARTLAQHMKECSNDKDQLHRRLDLHDAEVALKHAENLARFSKIDRTIYIAMGIGMALTFLGSHASEWLRLIVK